MNQWCESNNDLRIPKIKIGHIGRETGGQGLRRLRDHGHCDVWPVFLSGNEAKEFVRPQTYFLNQLDRTANGVSGSNVPFITGF